MPMPAFGVTNKEHYGMLWYFLEWSIANLCAHGDLLSMCDVAVTSSFR